VADGKLILFDETGTLILARATPTAYEELARARVLDGGLCWTAPALLKQRLYVRNQARAACLFLGSPESLDPNREFVHPVHQSPPFDWSRLLGREPDFPNDEPTVADVGLWFTWCVGGVFGAAGLAAALWWLIARATGRPRTSLWARVGFAVAAFMLGAAGTTIYSMWADTFVLTWPAALWVFFRVALAAGARARLQPANRRARLLARVSLVLFLALCYGYYRLCIAVGYFMAWSFLAGFLPAAPAALVAARARNRWLRAAGDAAGFAIYFWTSGMLPGWKSRWTA
jgi:hypothetical protein